MLERICDIYSINADVIYTDDITTMLLKGFKKLPPNLIMFSSKND